MDFYYAPTTCSQAAHILLHETGLQFRAIKVDVFTHRLEDGSDYESINPNGYVPALMPADGTLLTENVALLDWIAGHGEGLIPPGAMGRTRHLQMLAFISTELQKPFVRLFFSESETEKAELTTILSKRLRWTAAQLQGAYLFGDHFSAADAFLYVMLRWAAMTGMEIAHELQKLAQLVECRDSVRAVLARESVQPLHAAA